MATAAAAAGGGVRGTPATEYSFFDGPQRTKEVEIRNILDQSRGRIFLADDDDVEEALENAGYGPCLGRKIDTGSETFIAYFKKDGPFLKPKSSENKWLKTLATVISNEDTLLSDEQQSVTKALNGDSVRLMELLVQVDNAIQRRAQVCKYKLAQSMVDEDVDDPVFSPFGQNTSRTPRVNSRVEVGKTYVFKPVIKRSSKLEGGEPDKVVYMYDEDQLIDMPAVVLDDKSANEVKLPVFVVSSYFILSFLPLCFHVFCCHFISNPKETLPKEVKVKLTGISAPMITDCFPPSSPNRFMLEPSLAFSSFLFLMKQTSQNEGDNKYRIELGRYYFVCQGTHP